MQVNNKVKLFCLPYAGGSSAIYHKWHHKMHDNIDVIPIELAGRGKRILEPLYENTEAAVNDILNQIYKQIDGDFAFFGHSMGALLAYDLARKLKQEELKQPLHLFLSGRKVPDVRSKSKKYHLLNDTQFIKKIKSLGGTPSDFFYKQELLEIFLPVLRNDFRLASEGSNYVDMMPFDYDISVFVGKEEGIKPKHIEAWKNHTEGMCNVHYINGGHFFIKDEYSAVISVINKILN